MDKPEGTWELNFASTVKSMEDYPEQHHCHWLWKAAVEMPGTMQVWEFEEDGREFIRKAIYDPKTKIMHTNLVGCPARVSHHVGSTCGVCGMKD